MKVEDPNQCRLQLRRRAHRKLVIGSHLRREGVQVHDNTPPTDSPEPDLDSRTVRLISYGVNLVLQPYKYVSGISLKYSAVERRPAEMDIRKSIQPSIGREPPHALKKGRT
ncbi:Uncharacterised protein [Mycobacteroides abscessus subsp. massiliense]|nr:Uncharacterised protein [Mycobacteroides abscessus subsp. massiliense]